MQATKIFLGVSVAVWLPYGLFCLVSPGYLAEAAGVAATSATGTTEVRAMYGGLQAAIGALCLFALARPALRSPVLLVLCFLTGGLALARAVGFALDGDGSGYTFGALGFETANTLVAAYLWNASSNAEAIA
jgi:hypothetical protein